jgi:hypothetical protein
MELYEPTNITEEGRPFIPRKERNFLVVDLISDFLRELKNLALKDSKNVTDRNWDNSKEIRWVLTVPAIWTDASKHLMREAARKAGIIGTGQKEDDRLLIALEPEAAAVYCQERDREASEILSSSGTRFMIVDCGGGTIDITVHEVTHKRGLKEVVAGTGGSHGSTYVDKSFIEYLAGKNVLSAEALTEFYDLHPGSFLDLKEEWERTKCAIGLEDEEIYFPIPSYLHVLLRKKYPRVLERLSQRQEGDEHSIWLTKKVIQNDVFGPILRKVASRVEDIFNELKYQKLHIMFLVGGFSHSPLLQEHLRDKFANRVDRIIIPEVPSAAIVEGAASFGRDPSVIRARRTRLTYGIASRMTFEHGKDAESKKVWDEDHKEYSCEDRFSVFVNAGDSIGVDEEYRRSYYPVVRDQTQMRIVFYSTTKKRVRYADESHVTKLREILVDMPDKSGGREREVVVTMYFGRTEVECVARDKTSGNEVKTQLDFTYSYSSEQLGN